MSIRSTLIAMIKPLSPVAKYPMVHWVSARPTVAALVEERPIYMSPIIMVSFVSSRWKNVWSSWGLTVIK